jgi:hypothetical protein
MPDEQRGLDGENGVVALRIHSKIETDPSLGARGEHGQAAAVGHAPQVPFSGLIEAGCDALLAYLIASVGMDDCSNALARITSP